MENQWILEARERLRKKGEELLRFLATHGEAPCAAPYNGGRVLLHPNIGKPGWRTTYIHADGDPWGHNEYETWTKAAQEFQSEYKVPLVPYVPKVQ